MGNHQANCSGKVKNGIFRVATEASLDLMCQRKKENVEAWINSLSREVSDCVTKTSNGGPAETCVRQCLVDANKLLSMEEGRSYFGIANVDSKIETSNAVHPLFGDLKKLCEYVEKHPDYGEGVKERAKAFLNNIR